MHSLASMKKMYNKKTVFYRIFGFFAAVILSCTAGTAPALQDTPISTATVSQVDRESKIPDLEMKKGEWGMARSQSGFVSPGRGTFDQ